MNTTNQNEQLVILQAIEAIPLEDNSLTANETLREQQADDTKKLSVPVFIP